jgi:glycosyltransferase involved in cell wall biosynthesis
VVLDIPRQSRTVHFRAYAERLDDSSLIGWVVARCKQATNGESKICVLAGDQEASRLADAVPRADTVFMSSSGYSADIHDLLELSQRVDATRVLLIDMTAAMLPKPVWERTIAAFGRFRSDAAVVLGTPCVLPPIICERDALNKWIKEGATGSLRAIMSRQAQVRAIYPISQAEQDERSWPFVVRLHQPDEVDLLRTVLRKIAAGQDRPPEEPLDAWTEAAALSTAAPRPIARPAAPSSVPTVLYAQCPSAFSGGEQVLVSLVEAARDRRPSFRCAALVAQPGLLAQRAAAAGADVEVANREFTIASRDNYAYLATQLERVAPALVHVHSVVGVPFCCAVADRGIPFVQHVHVASDHLLGQLREQLSFASDIIAVSEFVKQRIRRLGIAAERIHVIKNGISTAAPPTDPRAARRALRLAPDDIVVAVVARMTANKRHDILIEACAQLADRRPQLRLLLAGEALPGDEAAFAALQRRIDGFRMRERVRCIGFYENMPAVYASANILALASEDDPFPMTILEGMRAGLPIVAANSGGIPEMIQHGTTGLLVEPQRADLFAAAIECLIAETRTREQLGEAARERCRVEFGMSRFANQVFALYDRIVRPTPSFVGAGW